MSDANIAAIMIGLQRAAAAAPPLQDVEAALKKQAEARLKEATQGDFKIMLAANDAKLRLEIAGVCTTDVTATKYVVWKRGFLLGKRSPLHDVINPLIRGNGTSPWHKYELESVFKTFISENYGADFRVTGGYADGELRIDWSVAEAPAEATA